MSKFNNRKIKREGYVFDSLSEYEHYQGLKLREYGGEISELKVHPRFELQPAFTDRSGKKQRAIVYEADFSYFDKEVGHTVIAEVKGFETQAWRLKYRMFLFCYRSYDLRVIK